MVGPVDLYVLAGVLATGERSRSLRSLATTMGLDHTMVHRALRRSEQVRLYRAGTGRVDRAGFEELVVHAARFVAPAPLGELVPGVPAAWAAEPMAERIRTDGEDPPPVWPDPRGVTRGQALEPLHRAAVAAAGRTPSLVELLVLIDSLRAGDARVRAVAADALHDVLRRPG
ncbi:MAG TPA: hypothetical protein VK506_08165 [Conexibacter sp.]|nr:hypothetical protein [Conexibacter sp.]